MKQVLKLFLIIIIAITLFLPISSFANNDAIEIYVNKKLIQFDVQPIMENSRVQVPVRFISEALGYEVGWNQAKQQAIIKANGKETILTVNSNEANVDGKPVILESTVVSQSSRTFVPLRFVSETLGAKVDYKYVNKVHRIDITTAGTSTGSGITSVGNITGFKTLDANKITGSAIMDNIATLATAVPKETIFINYENGRSATLYYNPTKESPHSGDDYLIVTSSNGTDYEACLAILVWVMPNFNDNQYCYATQSFAKEILRQYFPTSYETVYKLVDSSFIDGKSVGKVYKYDGRELIIRNAVYISYVGGNVKSVTPIK